MLQLVSSLSEPNDPVLGRRPDAGHAAFSSLFRMIRGSAPRLNSKRRLTFGLKSISVVVLDAGIAIMVDPAPP